MHTLVKWLAMGLLLAFLLAALAPAATAQTPVSLTVADPTGGIEVSQTFSARVSDLNGKTVCEVSNNMWEAYRTFPVITDLIQKQFPTAKIVSYDKFPSAGTAVSQQLVDAVKAAGCQAVIVGNAG